MVLVICAEVEKRMSVSQGRAQIARVCRLADVKDPAGYKETLSRRLQEHAANARAAGDKEKIARLTKYEDKDYRDKYCELAVQERCTRRFAEAEAKAASERMRRLREKVTSHRYILTPCGCSMHAVMKSPNKNAIMLKAELDAADAAAGTVSTFWPPQTDIDVHITAIPLAVDLAQARHLVRLVDYLKRWKREDNRMMWYPPPNKF